MTAAPPPRDSVLDALGYAIRIVGKPEFLWAPFLFYVILLLPLLGLPSMTSAPPPMATQADLEAYLRTFLPVFAGTIVLSLVLGPLANAVVYRLAQQFIDGAPPAPFEPGVGNLAWRFFLQGLAIFLLVMLATFAWVLAILLLQAIIGIGLALLLSFVGGVVGLIYLVTRIGLAPALLLRGAGPIEAIGQSWALTRGHVLQVFRWLIVAGLIVGIVASLVSGAVGAVFAAVGQPSVGQYLGGLLVAPAGLVSAIVQLLLTRLLMSPPQAPPPPPALPEWMNQTTPAVEPPAPPPAPASDGG